MGAVHCIKTRHSTAIPTPHLIFCNAAEGLQLLAAGTDIEIAVLIISEVGPGELALRCDLALVPDWDVGIDVAIDQPSLSKDLFNKLSHKQKYRGIEIRLFRLPQSCKSMFVRATTLLRLSRCNPNR